MWKGKMYTGNVYGYDMTMEDGVLRKLLFQELMA
jgi:hypothetical protein